MEEDQQFWVGQKAFIEKDGSILVLRDPKEGLDFPGGKIQVGEENLSESLRREVREETGLKIEVGDPFVVWWNEFPSRHKYAGHKVYLVGFRCHYISGDVNLSNEHDAWQWVTSVNYHEVRESTTYFRALEKYFANG